MGENFIKFKEKAFKIRLFKSIASAASLGLFVTGLLILLHKLELIGIMPFASAAIGFGAGLCLGCALFFILASSDIELARRLDKELSLDERVQTMLEYSGEASFMHELQRADANSRLSEVSPKHLRLRRIWIYVILFAVGAAMLVTSLVYSKPIVEEPAPEEEEFAITEIQIKAMNELIASVEESEMASPYRENTVKILTDLLGTLKETYTVREKDAAVKESMKKILIEVDNSSCALELMNALWSSETDELKSLAEAINYYEWPILDEWDKFLSEVAVFRADFIHPDATLEEPDENKISTETELVFLKASSGLVGAIEKSKLLPSDELSVVLTKLATASVENEDGTRIYGFAKLSELVSSHGYTAVQRELDATVSILSAELFAALSAHKENTDTGENAVKRIGDIFDTEILKFERPSFVESSEDGEAPSSDDENKGGSGAIGSGTEFGSDDLVLDPYTNTYVEYGVIIERYYALMFGGLENGGYTEEEKDAMEKYFAILYGGFEKGEENTDE